VKAAFFCFIEPFFGRTGPSSELNRRRESPTGENFSFASDFSALLIRKPREMPVSYLSL
jgi:hypothetical protein